MEALRGKVSDKMIGPWSSSNQVARSSRGTCLQTGDVVPKVKLCTPSRKVVLLWEVGI